MARATEISRIIESEDLPLEKFYRPSVSLTNKICDRIEVLEAEAIRGIEVKEKSDLEEANWDADDDPALLSSDPNAEMVIQQRLIAEELDGCLVDSAESSAAIDGEKLNIHEVVTEGMSDALGLDNSDHLLEELASEFQTWIDSIGCYTAGWGNIISAGDGHMYLERFPIVEEETTVPDFTFTRSHDSKQKQKPASGLLGRIAAMAAKLGVG